MPKPKPIAVVTFAEGPSPEARAELAQTIDALLVAANLGPPREDLRPMAMALHEALTFLAEGTDVHLSAPFNLRQRIAFDNLNAMVRSGSYHLRLCKECRNWFLAVDARRMVCASRPACQKASSRKRAAASRGAERERQRRARVTLKGAIRTR